MRLVVSACLAACSFAAVGRASAQPLPVPTPLTEADALRRQRAADPRVQALQLRTEVVRASQAERTPWPNPVLSVSREAVAGTSDLFVLGRQDLPISGRRGHLRTAARAAVESADADAAFERGQLQAALRQSFAQLLAAQEQETVLRQAIEELQQLIGVLRVREGAGEGSRYDRLRGERALVDLQDDLAVATTARARARIALAGHLGAGVVPEALLASGPLARGAPPALDEAIEHALQARADYRSVEQAANQFEAERRAAAALRLPTPSFGYGLKRSDSGGASHNGHQVSFDVAVPLFNRGQLAVATAATQLTRAGLDREALRLRVTSEVRAAHVTLVAALDRELRFAQATADVVEPLVEIARVAYDNGELGILELLDAARQRIDARLGAIDLAVRTRLAGIEFDRVTGVEVTP